MPLPKRNIKNFDMLNEKDRQKVLDKIKQKYMASDFFLLNGKYSWWENEENDLYNGL